jgi:hypothetical protein
MRIVYLVRPDELVSKLLTNIAGFDLNPLAVIAARTNFLLSLGTLIRHAPKVEIPVYFCDSIITPSEYTEELFAHAKIADRKVDTAKGTFSFPGEVIEKEKIEVVCALVEESVQVKRTRQQFLEQLHAKIRGLSEHAEKLVGDVFERIAVLNGEDQNGIWARFLKNQFAPVFVGDQTFDFVLGNPPWVNWQNLSDSYREKTWRLWEDYGLFSLSGHAARLGGGKKDLAMLFTYVCLDNYVKAGGRLGFVITQTLFKTKGAGDGFRRFRLGNREHFRVLQVDDLSDFQPFEGATNRTAVVTFQKGKKTTYPAEYSYWRKNPKSSIRFDDDLDDVLTQITAKQWKAKPIDASEPTSPWITARPKALDATRKAIGQSVYRAYAGSCTWANGVYWLRITSLNNAGNVIAKNLHEVGGLKDIRRVETALEPDLLFPLLRGRDVARWNASSSAFLLNVQDAIRRKGIDDDALKERFPLTYGYLRNFEDILRRRSGFRKYFCKEVGKGKTKRLEPIAPFYSLYNVGEYTLAPFKVCWGHTSEQLDAAVVSSERSQFLGERIVVPDQTAIFVPLEKEQEAHYLCAMLNCSITNLVTRAYVVLHFVTHVLNNIRVPQFAPSDKRHERLAELSERAHNLAKQETETSRKELEKIEIEIDNLAAEVWSITDAELRDIQYSLGDLR